MDEQEWLAGQFEANRDHLRVVAHRMLGSLAEAEDAVQEAWLRLSRSDAQSKIDNLGGWLTTVVARVCLDVLRSRRTRELGPHEVFPNEESQAAPEVEPPDTEKELLLAHSIGSALLVVLDALEPAERVAFVLHDMFDVTFNEIGPIVGRTPASARQLASRARRRVRGGSVRRDTQQLTRHRAVIGAFLAAARGGDLEALLAVLDPNVVLRADEPAVQTAAAHKWGGAGGLTSEIRGATAVAEIFNGRALGARPALVDGRAGTVWVHGERTLAVWEFTFGGGKITEIILSMDPARLAQLSVATE